jgi:hypothetical protein
MTKFTEEFLAQQAALYAAFVAADNEAKNACRFGEKDRANLAEFDAKRAYHKWRTFGLDLNSKP